MVSASRIIKKIAVGDTTTSHSSLLTPHFSIS